MLRAREFGTIIQHGPATGWPCKNLPPTLEWCFVGLLTVQHWVATFLYYLYRLIFLYGSESWAITKEDALRINALHQWCLRMLLSIKWYHFISNDEVRRQTDQPLTYENYPGTASYPVRAYRLNGRQCRRKADLDFLAFCVLEETTGTTADDLDEDCA